MPGAGSENHRPGKTESVRILADAGEHECALRARFAEFWGSSSGEPRAIYDAFISGCPLAHDVAFEAADEADVKGWWVWPKRAEPGQAILFLHGGGYMQGSAKAYRGFVSQIVSRARIPALVIDYPLAPEASVPAAPEAAIVAWRRLALRASTEERLSAIRQVAASRW